MLQGHLVVIWRRLRTVFAEMLVVWCVVTLLAIVWARLMRIHPNQVNFAAPRREALLTPVSMAELLQRGWLAGEEQLSVTDTGRKRLARWA